jgi:hypothetical protein
LPDDGKHPDSLDGWVFDPSYFKQVDYIEGGSADYKYNALDDGGMVIFRIVKGDQEKFIHLFNVHNGYYGHGFDMKVGQDAVHEGCV